MQLDRDSSRLLPNVILITPLLLSTTIVQQECGKIRLASTSKLLVAASTRRKPALSHTILDARFRQVNSHYHHFLSEHPVRSNHKSVPEVVLGGRGHQMRWSATRRTTRLVLGNLHSLPRVATAQTTRLRQ